MDFKEMQSTWANYVQRMTDWKADLGKQAIALRDSIKEKLKAPDNYVEGNRQFEYVAAYKLDTIYDDPERLHFANTEANSAGVLVFDLCVVVDHGPGTFPKNKAVIPVGIRYHKQQVQFALWNKQEDMIGKAAGWNEDRDNFADFVIAQLEKYYSWDPKEGLEDHRPIGF